MNRRSAPVYLILAVGVLSISTAAVFIKRCTDADPAVIAAARLGVAALLLAPITLAVHGRRFITVPRPLRVRILFAGIFLAAHFYFWISSLKHTSVLSSVVIVTTNPVFVGLLSYLFLKERIGARLILGIFLAILGGGVIAWSDTRSSPGSLYGNLLALGGAVMASCYLLIGRSARREVDILSYLLPVYGAAAILLVAAAAITIGLRGENVLAYRPSTYLYFILLAVIPQLIGHGALNWALRHATATLVSVCILGEPIGATLLAYAFLGESMSRWQAVGGAVILAGIYLAARDRPPDDAETAP